MSFWKNKKSDSRAIGMKFVLEHMGTPLYELKAEEYNGEIVIGRSQSCIWTLNGIDSSASMKHAVITKRRNDYYLTDLGSRNGVYFQNKRIKERKLTIGDRISLGECTVLVERIEDEKKMYSQFHRLEYMDAKGHRTTVDINKPQMVIGSSPDSDIIIQNQLISSHHAELILRSDGSCWIKDLNSRNGTSVNGMDLTMESERMLQDNDMINIAYFEIRFLDAAVEHRDSKLWTTVITLAVTVLILMAGYIGYLKLTPDSNKYIEMAKIEMNAGRYNSALEFLESAGTSEGSENTSYERESLIRKIYLWKSVIATWRNVQNDLKNRKYLRATQKLASLPNDELNAWTWPRGSTAKEVGVSEKNKSILIKKLLDARSAALGIIQNEYASLEDISIVRSKLALALSDVKVINEDYTKNIHSDISEYLDRIDKILKDDRDLKTALNLLTDVNPNYEAIISRLKKITKESSGTVKARAEKILVPITALHNETNRFLNIIDKVGEMDFDAVNNFSLNLSENIDWAIEKNIGAHKRKLMSQVVEFKDMALQLSLMHRSLVNKGVIVGKEIKALADFLSKENLNALYQFDCFRYSVPKQKRMKPIGIYDQLLGIEFFYDFISNLSEEQEFMLTLEDLPFIPQIYKARQVLAEIEKFLLFSKRDDHLWFKRKAFAKYIEHCENILKERDKIVKLHLSYSYERGSRGFIVSRGIAVFLLPEGKLRNEIAQEVTKSQDSLKKRLAVELKDYDVATPTEIIKIRANIIKIGMPGSSVVKRMWAQR